MRWHDFHLPVILERTFIRSPNNCFDPVWCRSKCCGWMCVTRGTNTHFLSYLKETILMGNTGIPFLEPPKKFQCSKHLRHICIKICAQRKEWGAEWAEFLVSTASIRRLETAWVPNYFPKYQSICFDLRYLVLLRNPGCSQYHHMVLHEFPWPMAASAGNGRQPTPCSFDPLCGGRPEMSCCWDLPVRSILEDEKKHPKTVGFSRNLYQHLVVSSCVASRWT